MKWFNGFTFRLTFLGFVLALLTCGGRARADFVVGAPTNLGPTVNSGVYEFDPALSRDGLSLFFGSDRAGGEGGVDLWVTTRPTTDDPWGAPVNLGPTVNGPYHETDPALSADGLTLYFDSYQPGGYGGRDFWMTTRPTTADPWGPPVNLGPPVNSEFDESDPSLSPDGLALYFCDWGYPQTRPRPGGYGDCDILVAIRNTTDEAWGPPANLGPLVNGEQEDWSPSISADSLVLLFTSSRPGGSGGTDTWLTRRRSISEPWSVPVNLGPRVNSPYTDTDPDLSADGRSLFFSSDRPGGSGNDDLWKASVDPVVDFNGDGRVDGTEVLRVVDHWDTDDSLCDIGPMPWGDGVVDLEDLIVLAEYIGEGVDDPTLVAHWALDETADVIARNSVADCDGTLMNGAVWRPTGGIVDGALELDGIDDYVSTPFVLDPAEGPFSVLAWIKGGAPGQVIVSQEGEAGKDWLLADPTNGTLMTELASPVRREKANLYSDAVITDGDWHRVGFTWDGISRILSVDGEEVARDSTQSTLSPSSGGLYIGCGKDMAPGSYFSGLIDDMRIYNRAVKP